MIGKEVLFLRATKVQRERHPYSSSHFIGSDHYSKKDTLFKKTLGKKEVAPSAHSRSSFTGK